MLSPYLLLMASLSNCATPTVQTISTKDVVDVEVAIPSVGEEPVCFEQEDGFSVEEFSNTGLLRVLGQTEISEHMTAASEELVIRLSRSGMSNIVLAEDKIGYTVLQTRISLDEIETLTQRPIVFHEHSPIGNVWLNELGTSEPFVREYLDWFVLTPSVWHQKAGKQRQVLGMTPVGSPFAYLDTQRGDKSIRSILESLVVAAHEAGHKRVKELKAQGILFTYLQEELFCHEKEIEALDELLKRHPQDETLQEHYADIKGRLATGKYLQKPVFGNDFQNLTPHGTILAGNMLEDSIPKATLEKYAKDDFSSGTGDIVRDTQLREAAKMALFYHNGQLDKVTEATGMDGEEYKLTRLNAREVLSFSDKPLSEEICIPERGYDPAIEEILFGYVNLIDGDVHDEFFFDRF